MKLVIAEKPDMAKAYAEAMGTRDKFTKGNGYLKNSQYIIVWAFGHIVSSKEAGDYPEFGGWNWESIPFVPPSGKLDYHLPIKIDFDKVKKQQLDNIKKLYKENNIEEVINGCDAGREGDMIFWEVYEVLKMKAPVKRLWVQSKVDKDIQKAFDSLRDESFFGPRRESAYARQFADWILGQNLTVAFTVKSGRTLHVGRVQTPTLSLLVRRRLEIEKFQAKDYFEIKTSFGDKYEGTWFKESKGNTRLDQKTDAEAIKQKIVNQESKVTIKNVEEAKVKPKELFDLGSLSAETNKKFGFTMKKTLDVAQLLYDKYKVLSYPRTDSKYIMSSQIPELPELLKAVDSPQYNEFVEDIFDRGVPSGKHFVNDKKVKDHYAIIPTSKPVNWNEVKDEIVKGEVIATKEDIQKLYDLVIKRFLSVFYPAAVYEKTEIVTEVAGETFKTNGRILKEAGWQIIYGKDVNDNENENENENENDGKTLPPIEKDEMNLVKDIHIIPKQTKAKPHYTEGTIGTAMENAKDYLEEEELKAEMKEADAGLGTVATRPQIIENLISRKYATRKGKQLIATDLGVQLIQIAPDGLKSPEVTAQWEKELRLMEEEKVIREDFNIRIVDFVSKEIDLLKNKIIDIVFEDDRNKSVGKCPKCGLDIVEFSKGYSCKTSTRDTACFRIWKSVLNKKITLSQLKQLLEKGETNLVKGFKTNSGKTFDAKLKLKPEYDGVEFVFEKKEVKEMEMKCPKCNGKVFDRGTFIHCENNSRDNSCFSLPKEYGGKKLSQKVISDLALKGKTELIDGFKGKSKNTFPAYLKYNNGKLEYEFPERKPIEKKETSLACPSCGGTVLEMEKMYGCSNYSSKNCKFTVWKNIGGKEMTLELIRDVLEKGQTEKFDGFISKANKPYSAKLKWNPTKKTIEISFD